MHRMGFWSICFHNLKGFKRPRCRGNDSGLPNISLNPMSFWKLLFWLRSHHKFNWNNSLLKSFQRHFLPFNQRRSLGNHFCDLFARKNVVPILMVVKVVKQPFLSEWFLVLLAVKLSASSGPCSSNRRLVVPCCADAVPATSRSQPRRLYAQTFLPVVVKKRIF